MKASNVALGVIGGIATGAILGVLFAPEKGSNTRRKIVEKQKDLRNSLKKKANELVENSTTNFHDLRAGTEEALEEGKSNLSNLKEMNKGRTF